MSRTVKIFTFLAIASFIACATAASVDFPEIAKTLEKFFFLMFVFGIGFSLLAIANFAEENPISDI